MKKRLLKFISWLAGLPRPFAVALSLVLFLIIATLDYLSGEHFLVSALYLLPVALVSWRVGFKSGATLGVICAVTLALLNPGEIHADIHSLLALWNLAVIAIIFGVVAWLLSEVRRLREREDLLQRTDMLTGAANRTSFINEVDQEILRALRHGQSLSLICVDLDDFHAINDRLGHKEGDRLLAAVGDTLMQAVRGIDTLGRLGADEFVILLPNASSDAANTVAPRLRQALTDRMRRDLWPVTFSIGVLTCPLPPQSAEQLLHQADELMHRAKQAGRDRVIYSLQSA